MTIEQTHAAVTWTVLMLTAILMGFSTLMALADWLEAAAEIPDFNTDYGMGK